MDAVTTVKVASEVANSQVVWSILCIAMTVYLLYSQKQEKKEWREDRRDSIEAQKELANTMKEISITVSEMNNGINDLKSRVDDMERDRAVNYNNRKNNSPNRERG